MNHTQLNQTARKQIAKLAQQYNLNRCEIKLAGCLGEAQAPAHRHKRVWYYNKPPELLWDMKQWLAACYNCHMKIEFNKQLTMEIFNRLRGEE